MREQLEEAGELKKELDASQFSLNKYKWIQRTLNLKNRGSLFITAWALFGYTERNFGKIKWGSKK